MRRMMLTAVLGLVSVTVGVSPVMGQAEWIPAKCDLPGAGQYLVASAVVYLSKSKDTHFDEVKDRELRDAYRVLNQALTTGQDKNPGAWYYLARYYIERKDMVGMDSSFTKAEALDPKCHDDIYYWRHNNWVPIDNNAVHARNAGPRGARRRLAFGHALLQRRPIRLGGDVFQQGPGHRAGSEIREDPQGLDVQPRGGRA